MVNIKQLFVLTLIF